ncbi:MAG: hypothetical protein HZB10_03745 [Candidatus Yonathbacteria bacterium]|nr:hypothetical protein [Candidatus Yonathbacteria bacterium]
MPEYNVIIQLAEKVLNEEGQDAVEGHLINNRVDLAQCYILGGIDSLWTKKIITDSEAAEVYRILGMNPEKACDARQGSK